MNERYPVMNLGQVPMDQMPPAAPGCVRVTATPPADVAEYDAKVKYLATKYPQASQPGSGDEYLLKVELQALDAGPLGVAWHNYHANLDASQRADVARVLNSLQDAYVSKGWTVTPVSMSPGGPVVAWDACPPKAQAATVPVKAAPAAGPNAIPPPAASSPSSSTPLLVGGGIAAAGAAALLLAGRRSVWLGQVPLRLPKRGGL